MPSMTRSVIVVIVCLETSAPYTSARCALISPWVSPFADREITMSSTPVSRRCLLATILGSKLESRSRGTVISTGPALGDHRLRPVAVPGIPAVTAGRVVLAVAEGGIPLAFQRALDHHLRQLPQRPALTGQPQPARTSPLGQLPQRLLIGRRQLHGLLAIIGRHVSHWCLLPLGGYTIEISVPPCLLG